MTDLFRRSLARWVGARSGAGPGRPKRRAGQQPASFRPQLLRLEDRVAPAVTLLGASQTVTENSGSNYSATIGSYSVGAGNDRLLIVSTGGGGNTATVSGVTFGGTSLTRGPHQASAPSTDAEIWYLPLGSSGTSRTGNVVVSYTANFFFIATATAFQGADQTTPVSNATANQNASFAVTSATGNMVLDAIATDASSAMTAGGAQTARASVGNLAYGGADTASSTAPGAASVTMSWSGGGGNVCHAAVNINQVPVVPTVSGVSPAAGPLGGGTSVTLSGTNLSGATAVLFGTTPASFTVNSATSITATAPAGSAGAVDVTVTTPGGTSVTSAADQFTYDAAPAVSGVSPSAGPLSGGTSVTLTGTDLSGASAVLFGTTPAVSFTVNSPTSITATAPAGGAGAVDVTVKTPGGTSATSAADQFTYVAAPTVGGVSPGAGPLAGGTTVTLTGTNFSGATAIRFGTTAALSFTVVSPTSITADAPAGSAGVMDVTVTTEGGTSATSAADQFTYVAAPAVSGVSPSAGPLAGGTSVTLTGTGFGGATSVLFGATPASFTVNSPTSITATAPAGSAGAVDVTVTTVGGTSATSPADQFTYMAAPAVSGVSPAAGPLGGGTSVTLTGTGFGGATAVLFGTTPASFTVYSPTSITAVAPAGSAGAVDVTVTTPGGTSPTSAADQFTYVAAPAVSGVSPGAGPLAGGTSVTLTGTGFGGATSVLFGATPASFTVNSPTSITATAPAGSAGAVDVTVTTVGGTSATSPADQFTYTVAPAVSGVSPAAGPLANGTSVTLTGTGFGGATSVLFGSAPALSFMVNSSTSITAVAPASSAGAVDVTVTTVGGTSATNPADRFTYMAVPTVTSLSPGGGPLTGGTSVTLTGTGFGGATAVLFGTTPASFTVYSPTSITAVAPAGSAGAVDVTVTTPGGTSATSATDRFAYVPAPAVTGINPAAGPLAAGTIVTLTGTNFNYATPILFGTTPAASVIVVSPTSITVVAPAGSAGAVDVTVTTVGGTSATGAADRFTYVAAPTVSGVIPGAGRLAAGTTVTLIGTNFSGSTSVLFGTTPAVSFTVNSPTSITATAPSGSAGTVDVTVTTVGGTSATSPADHFTYVAAPTVGGVIPAAGPLAGGTSVTLTGTNFGGAFLVLFGMTPVAFTVNSPTSITAVAPAGSAGAVDVTVTTVGGTSATSPADRFTYMAAPTVTGLSPVAGPLAGGTSVTLTGTGLGAVTAVLFGTTPAASFTIISPTSIAATAPAGSAGAVDVTVTNPGGTSATSPADQFAYVPAPAVTGLSPAKGPQSGGTTVTITGANLANATEVDFGSTAVTHFLSDTAGQITLLSPVGTGVVDVTVVTAGGRSAPVAADKFTYAVPPPPSVSVAFGPRGEVIELVSTSGILTQRDWTGSHVIGAGIRSAGVAFGPQGQVLVEVLKSGLLYQFDATGAHQLASGIQSADVAFGPQGEVLALVTTGGVLIQTDASGAHQLASGVGSASVAFGPAGEVIDIVTTAGTLVQTDAAGAHVSLSGVASAGTAFVSTGAQVFDVIFEDGTLMQYDAAGAHNMGQVA